MKKVLIAEDDNVNASILSQTLINAGYHTVVKHDGDEAFKAVQEQNYDAILTDWMMPKTDGIELIRKIRAYKKPVPLIIVITALSSDQSCRHALDSGADDFLSKPFKPQEVKNKLDNLFSRKEQKVSITPKTGESPVKTYVDFLGVGITSSTGGPKALDIILGELPETDKAAFFLIQHSPAWALKEMVSRLNTRSKMKIVPAEDGIVISPGYIYLAPGERHMIVANDDKKIHLIDDPPENYVRPSADPLFNSISKYFGEKSMAIVLTGMGCDGTLGAARISEVNGVVIVQDPKTATAASMPQTVIKNVNSSIISPLSEIHRTISNQIDKQYDQLMGQP